MRLLHQDRSRIHRALALAREAAAFASPNPTVGCVLTSAEDEFLAEGAHFYDRRDHAEIAALKQAAERGRSVRGATAYVTLEPCAHHGRTGPCADALIAAGMARCVVATADPNPQVSGRGLARLAAAGVETLVLAPADELAVEARRLNDAFAFAIQHHRPFVTLKSAVSIDGKLAPPAAARAAAAAPVWLTGPAARADVQHLRHASDALLTGVGTILADDPALTDRTGQPRRRPLLRVILDTRLRTPPTARLFANTSARAALQAANAPTNDPPRPPSPHGTAALHPPDVLLVCSAAAPASSEAALQAAGAEVLRVPELTPLAVLGALEARGIRSVLLEAGPGLNGAFLAADLVDRVVLYFADTELGPAAVPFSAGGHSPYTLQQRLTALTRTTFAHGNSEDVRLTGYLHDPWLPALAPVHGNLHPK